MTIAFLVAVVVCVVTTGTCQEIHNGRNASNFQEAQTRQTNIMVDFFSDVEAKGSELTKQEAGCPGKEQKLPPLLQVNQVKKTSGRKLIVSNYYNQDKLLSLIQPKKGHVN